jgi:predicted ATPase
MYRALILWFLGYPDQTLTGIDNALTFAQKLVQPPSLAFVLFVAALLHQLRREERATWERVEACRALAHERGLAHWLVWGTTLRGWVLVEQGQKEEGLAQLREGLAAARAMGVELARPYYLALLAEACGRIGQAEEGLALLAEALAVVDKTREGMHEAELYRLKGELTLQSSIQRLASSVQTPQSAFRNLQSEAEACFHKAIEIARKQQAKSLELRAVMSLSRLWQRQGKKVEARQMLAEIYGWFTEGFDTKDLQEAKALLDSLGSSV